MHHYLALTKVNDMLFRSERKPCCLPGGGFITVIAFALVLFGGERALSAPDVDRDKVLLVEAESFDDLGGWVLDQQFMDLMGSPYLLAHGMGRPVADAVTSVEVPRPGDYRVWVRTRDWVAPWKASGAPGRFKVVVDGEALEATFG